jgi:GNAT superfamily N-acetyltransferase
MSTIHAATIEPVTATGFGEFLEYLSDHLSDNGADNLYFQPLQRGTLRLPSDKEQAFRAGLEIPVGSPGWGRQWVARNLHRQIIGHIGLRSHPERFAEHRCLLGMGVDRDHRKQGLGAALLSHAETWVVATTAIEWIDLQALSENAPAIQLYLRMGFTRIGEIPEMFRIDGRTFSYTSMTKRLFASRPR